MMHRRQPTLVSAASALCVLLGLLCSAVRCPAEELASLVPDDVGLTIELRDVAAHWERFQAGELCSRWRNFPPLAAFLARSAGERAGVSARFEELFGLSLRDLRNQVFGRDVLFAVWPPDRPGSDGPALLLVEAPDAPLLRQVVDRFVEQRKQAGKLKEARELEFGGRTITVYQIEGQANRPAVFLAAWNELGVMTTSGPILERVLKARSLPADDRVGLAALAGYRAGSKRLNPAACLRAFVNPGPWNNLMGADPARTPQLPRLRQAVVATWQASDYLVASVDIGERFEAEAFLAFDDAKLPLPVREVLASAGGGCELFEKVPDDALIALLGRLDVGQLVQSFARGDLQPWSGRPPPSLALAGVLAVASGLGKDVALYVLPPKTEADGQPWPIDWLIGLQTQPVEPDSPNLGEALDPLVRAALRFAVQNDRLRRPDSLARVASTERDGLRITSVEGMGQRAPRVLYTQRGGLVWAGTSTARLVAAAGGAAGSRAQAHRLQPLLNPRVGRPSDLLFVDLAGLERLLDKPASAEMLSAAKGLDPSATRRRLDELGDLLKLGDKLVAQVAIDSAGVGVALHVSLDEAAAEPGSAVDQKRP
jgi:hypothetical protein